jgi:hypothetical protein
MTQNHLPFAKLRAIRAATMKITNFRGVMSHNYTYGTKITVNNAATIITSHKEDDSGKKWQR